LGDGGRQSKQSAYPLKRYPSSYRILEPSCTVALWLLLEYESSVGWLAISADPP
jgi:hypothetical protein